MEQRISLITLGVADLQRAVDFYENVVGWKPELSPPGVVFFDLFFSDRKKSFAFSSPIG